MPFQMTHIEKQIESVSFCFRHTKTPTMMVPALLKRSAFAASPASYKQRTVA